MKLSRFDIRTGCDNTLALLSVESELINSIRWYKTRQHDTLPFVKFRRFSACLDIRTGGNHPLCNNVPLYRLDGKQITDAVEYDIVSCARGLFLDIEDMIKKSGGARFGIFKDMSVIASKNHLCDYTDGGLFLTWVNTDITDEQRIVECQVMIAGAR